MKNRNLLLDDIVHVQGLEKGWYARIIGVAPNDEFQLITIPGENIEGGITFNIYDSRILTKIPEKECLVLQILDEYNGL